MVFSTQYTIGSTGSDSFASRSFLINLHLFINAKFGKFSYEVKSVDLFTKYPTLWSLTLGSNLLSGILINICLPVIDKYRGSVTADTEYASEFGILFTYPNVTSTAVLVLLFRTLFIKVLEGSGLP